MWSNWNVHTLMVEVSKLTTTLKNWQFLLKLDLYFPYDPEIPLLGVYSRDEKHVYKETWARALFII